MGFHGGGSALDRVGGQRQVTVFLGNHLQINLQPVFLEQTGLVGQGQRGKTGPTRHAQGQLDLLGLCLECHGGGEGTDQHQRCQFDV